MTWSGSYNTEIAQVAVEFMAAPEAPAITTGSASGIFSTSASITGNEVTSAGDASVSERGVVVHTSSTPTTSNTKIAVAGAVGSFDAEITGLEAETTYYARAFATNSIGTAYGSEVSFTTDINAAMPIMMADNPVNFNTPIIL